MNNLLPKDGTVHYYGKFSRKNKVKYIMLNCSMKSIGKYDVVKIFWKEIITKRKVAF